MIIPRINQNIFGGPFLEKSAPLHPVAIFAFYNILILLKIFKKEECEIEGAL